MDLSGIIAAIAVISVIGRVVKSIQKNEAIKDNQKRQMPQIPYRQDKRSASAHESAAKPRAWMGMDALRDIIKDLEEGASGDTSPKQQAANFAQAFEEPTLQIPMYQGEGTAAMEGTYAVQETDRAEGSSYGQMPADSAEGTSFEMVGGSIDGGTVNEPPVAYMTVRRGSFTNVADLRRAVILNEVLGKPVSLRNKRAI